MSHSARLAVALLCLALVACGQAAAPSPAATTAATTAGPVTIRAILGANGAGFTMDTALAAEFTSQTGIQVETIAGAEFGHRPPLAVPAAAQHRQRCRYLSDRCDLAGYFGRLRP